MLGERITGAVKLHSNRSPGLLSVIPHSRPFLGDNERDAVVAALGCGWVGAGGDAAERFDHELAGYLRRPAALGVSSGTSALEIALRICGVAGGPVGMPAYSCASIERAIVRAGGVPHLVDVDPDDLSFPPGRLESLARECVGLVLVHQFGIPATCAPDIGELSVPVVEDVTTGIGAALAGRQVGAFGRLTVLSMSATKMLCAGEGGAVAGDPDDVELARRWADPESSLPRDQPAFNAKLSALGCALGQAQLRRLPLFLARRDEVAAYYDQALGDHSQRVIRPRTTDRGTWWRYLVTVPAGDADMIVERANARGVRFARPVTERRWAAMGRFPVSDRLHASVVSVPIYPALTDGEVERVAATLKDLVA